jgi:hypothetical protein
MGVDLLAADLQSTFRGPYLIPTSTLDLHSAVAAVIGYPQPVARKLVEERFSKTYKSDYELDKLHAKINYQFNGGKHKTVHLQSSGLIDTAIQILICRISRC